VENGRLIIAAAFIFATAVCSTQCTSNAPGANPPVPSAQGPMPDLIGPPIKPIVSVKELMQYMIDPISDNIFDAVYWDSTRSGVVKHAPKTNDDWDKVMTGAVSLAEGVELLKVRRPWAPAGDVNHSTGPHPPELSPTEIQAKLDKDPVLWEAKIQALRNAALEIVDVTKKKDADQLFVAMKDVDEACEGCHLEYWYPGDAAAVQEWKNARARFEKPPAAASHK
jgi:cytochrome c556